MDTCKNCIYRVYDEQIGAYKCEIYQHRLRDIYKYIGCESHERKGKDDV